MKKLFEEHYQATRKRGKITDQTTRSDFFEKLNEEIEEMKIAFDNPHILNFEQEAIDCICVIANMLQHYNVDIEKELKINLDHQQTRKD